MVIVGVMKQTGLFEYLAIWSAKGPGGSRSGSWSPWSRMTAVASALLDNVTTVLLIAPVTFLICERLELPAAPFLIALALASNIGGTATLIGDPPNIIIASESGLSYTDFLVNLAPLVVLLCLCSWACAGCCSARLGLPAGTGAASSWAWMSARPRDRPLLVRSLAVLALPPPSGSPCTGCSTTTLR